MMLTEDEERRLDVVVNSIQDNSEAIVRAVDEALKLASKAGEKRERDLNRF